MEAHIYIYGVINYWQDEEASKYGVVNLKDIKNQWDKQKEEATSMIVHIHSDGGDVDEGLAIHDFVKSQGVPVTTVNEGNCHSIASIIFLAGTQRKMNTNASLLIHLPSGGVYGTSDDIEKYAEKLNAIRDKIAGMYERVTNLSKEEILQHMKDEKEFTADEAVTIGLATEKVEQLKAVAFFKRETKPNNQMAVAKEIEEAIQKETNGLFEKIQNLFKSAKKPMNIVIQDANGVSLDFADVEDREPEVGDMATVEGAPAEGEYVMPDGRTLVFAAGSLTEIKEAEPEESEEMEQMRAENETLKAENAQLKAGLDEVKNQFTQLKASMTSAGIQFGKPKAKGTQHKQESTEPTNRAAGLKDRLNK